MTTPDDRRKPAEHEDLGIDERGLEEALADYIDRLNRGQMLDEDMVLSEQPDLGPEIWSRLEVFETVGASLGNEEPLGKLGDFTLRRQLGRGGMGVVYEAWQHSMDRIVALKVLPPAVAIDDRAYSRFMQEARAAGKLSHPNVVAVHASGQDEQTPYYAMEFVEGETLAQLLARVKDADSETETTFGPKDQGDYFIRLARAFADVADGLQHAHSKGVVHRDIKPSNLILDGGDRLRILDFGLARLEGQESLTASGDFVGTPLYMSPEQARRKKVPVDHRTDVYSLGATMYEAVCGRPPFRGKDHADTLSQIIERDPLEPRKLNPRIPSDLETVVLKCLRKDSSDRYGTAEALAQDLRRFLRGDRVEATPQPVWRRRARWFRRRWRAVVVAAIVVTALVSLGLAVKWSSDVNRRYALDTHDKLVLDAVMTIELEALDSHVAKSVGEPGGFLIAGEIPAPRLGIREKSLDAAVEKLRTAKELIPDRPEAPYHRGRALLALGKIEEAKAEFVVALDRDPQFTPARMLMRQVAGSSWLEKDPEGEGPETPRPWAQAWVTAFHSREAGRWKLAADAFDELVRLSRRGDSPYRGAAPEALLGRGIAHLNGGNYDAALEDFAVARYWWTDHREPTLLIAKTYLLSGNDNRQKAESIFRKLFDGDAEKDEAALSIAMVYRSLGEYGESLRWAAELNEPRLSARVHSDLYLRQRAFAKAIDAARRAVDLDPRDSVALELFGVAKYWDGWFRGTLTTEKLDELVGTFKQVIAFDPDNARAHAQLGMVHGRRLEFDEALSECERAIEIAPENPLGYRLASWILHWDGKPIEAESYGKRALDLCEQTGCVMLASLCRDAAFAHSIRGESETALSLYKRALETDTSPCTGKSLCVRELSTLGAATANLSLENYAEAETFAHEFLEENPHSPVGRAYLGYSQLEGGKFSEALATAEEAIARYPESPGPLWFHAQVLERSEGPDAALPDLLRALALDPSHTASQRDTVRLLGAGTGATEPQLSESVDVLRRAISTSEDEALARIFALLAVRTTDSALREEALAVATETVQSNQRRDPGALATLAEVQFHLDDAEQAVLHLEEAIALPGACESHAKLLGRYRREILPRVVSWSSVDAVLATGATGSKLAVSNDSPRAEQIQRYLNGRVLQANGQFEKALEEFRAAARATEAGDESYLRVAECLTSLGNTASAEEYLWGLLERGAVGRSVWERWAALALADLELEAGDLLTRLQENEKDPLPAKAGSQEADLSLGVKAWQSSYRDDLRWLLHCLAEGDSLRINCGTRQAHESNEARWSRDRFFTDGMTIRPFHRSRFFKDDVAGTEDDVLYWTERRFQKGALASEYRLPLPKGRYLVRLHFADTMNPRPESRYHTDMEKIRQEVTPPRTFDVLIEGKRVLTEHTPLDAGFATANVRSFSADVDDGVLVVRFSAREREAFVSALEVERMR